MASLNFFHDSAVVEQNFFDEGPKASTIRDLSSGSIDTSAIDRFRQGVELTQIKHYDAGTFKIHSGEPGNHLAILNYGQGCNTYAKNVATNQSFQDLDRFLATTYISSQAVRPSLNVLSSPIIIVDNQPAREYVMDGVLEPLTIRQLGHDIPVEIHSIKGHIAHGNSDAFGACDRIIQVKRWHDDHGKCNAFVDNAFKSLTYDKSTEFIGPFVDEKNDIVNEHITMEIWDKSFAESLSMMTGSTENYVPHNYNSSTCGWEYDNNVMVGTDSIAFGGMTY